MKQGEIREHFAALHLSTPERVLEYTAEVSQKLGKKLGRTKVTSAQLPEIISRLTKSRSVEPHHAPIYALKASGYSEKQIAEHLGLNKRSIRGICTSAKLILKGRQKGSVWKIGETLEGRGKLEVKDFWRHAEAISQEISGEPVKPTSIKNGAPVADVRKINHLPLEQLKQMQENRGLIGTLFKRGHPNLRRDWDRYLHKEHAERFAIAGLVHAVQNFDKRRGIKFSNYAMKCMAGRVSREVTKVANGWKKTESLDAILPHHEKLTLHGKLIAPQISREGQNAKEALETLVKMHRKKQIPASNVVIVALTLMGHDGLEIGRHFNLSGQAIRAALAETIKQLKQQLKN